MLDDTSYHTALYAYCGAGVLIALLLAFWIGRRGYRGFAALLSLLSAALLLTPAYPREGVDTMAPALVVAGFQYFTEGMEAAEHALRPLGASCAVAVALALLLWLTLLRRRSDAAQDGEEGAGRGQ